MEYQSVVKAVFTIIIHCIICTVNLFAGGPDTCLVNDHCSNATVIQNVSSDEPFVCIQGCNEFASPDTIVAGCQTGDFPTVWYVVNVDSQATILNIEVRTEDFESPSISLFKSISGCAGLETVFLANGNMTCVIGSDGVAKAIGTQITPLTTYYIAVSSVLSIGGDFELCVSTISDGSYCVLDRSMEVISRSNGGPIEGPFDPGEKLRVCINVDQYTAAGNGCQWFQGLVPAFGNGWDPSSFDSLGQPYNAEVNDQPIGESGNGVYGTSIWGWFDDVGYHHVNPRLNIGDFDNNGKPELCNSVYEVECQFSNGVLGGCCGPCWEDNQGEILPPGWFAYGINGTCSTAGPPIKVDWGDGNTCGCCMGSWSFCFDLITRDTPDCLGDSTKNDLLLGFYTFADGEIGAWTGNGSVCSYDQPLKVSLKALCGRITRREPEQLPTLNSEDVFTYVIDDREVANWEWNISPYWVMPHSINRGANGVTIENQVFNSTGEPVEVKIIFIGHEIGSEDLIIKKVSFLVNPWTTGIGAIGNDEKLKVFPNPANTKATIEWPQSMTGANQLVMYNSQGLLVRTWNIEDQSKRKQEIDVSTLSPGVYFIHWSGKDKINTAKLIKY